MSAGTAPAGRRPMLLQSAKKLAAELTERLREREKNPGQRIRPKPLSVALPLRTPASEPRSETQPSNLPEGKVHHHQLKNDDESRGRPGQDEYARKNQERAYSADLDTAFWGTGFETYVVSQRVKRKGGGTEIGAATIFCGALVLGSQQCNWLHKTVFATSSNHRLGPASLLFLASRDGFSNREFHKRCDLKGSTLTIVSTGDGRVFGGYAQESWLACAPGALLALRKWGRYAEDAGAFLFVLSDDSGRGPEKIAQTGNSAADAVFYDADLGPCWGRALGLQLDILAYSSSDLCGSAKYQRPRWGEDRTVLARSYNGWDIQEVAVFQV